MFSKLIPFLQRARSRQASLATMHRLLFVAFVAVAIGGGLSVRGHAQIQTVTAPTITVFLADPQQGVVGVCQGNGNTLYFEARTPEGSTQLSARLLDADGNTIAISGTSMDSAWLDNNATYTAASASQSLSLASALASRITTALPGGTVFSRETAALSNLAAAMSQAPAGTTMTRIDSAITNLPAISTDVATLAAQYDASAASNLAFSRDSLGNLNVTFPGANFQSFVLNLPDEPNEDTGGTGVVEVSVQFTISDGTSVAQVLGGEYIPDAWYPKMFQDAPTSTFGPIQTYKETGNAIRGAMLLTRFPSIATAEETEVISALAKNLRSNALLPIPSSAAASGDLYSRIAIWKKPLVVIAEHSGTIVRHLQGQPGHLVQKNETIYCNHGTCPGAKPMAFKCMWTSPGLSSWRNVPHGVVPNGQQGAGELHSCYKTNYDVFSGSTCPWCNPGHNCHDDSWTQLRAIKGESYNLTGGPRCNEHTLYKSAPNCGD
jgi:hypothetical protein